MKQGKKLVCCFITIVMLISSMTQIALANTPTAQNVNWQNGRPGMAVYDVTEDMEEYKFCLYKDGQKVYSTYGSGGYSDTNYDEMLVKMDNLGYGTYKFNIVTMDESGEFELAESSFSDEFVYQDLPDISEVTNIQFNGYTVTWDYPDDKADYFYVDIRKDKNDTNTTGRVIGYPCYEEKSFTIPEYTIKQFEQRGQKLDELFVSIYALPKDRNTYNLSKSPYYSNKGGEITDIKVDIKNEGYDYKCGANATWSYNDGILTISGTGTVDDSSEIDDFYSKENFRLYGEAFDDGSTSVTEGALKIKAIVFEEGVTQINETFRGPRTECIVIPESMKKIEGIPFNPGVGYGLKTTYHHDGLKVIYNYSKDCEFSEKWKDTDIGIAIYTPKDSYLYKLLDNAYNIDTEEKFNTIQKVSPTSNSTAYKTDGDVYIRGAKPSHVLIDINKTTEHYMTFSDKIHLDAVITSYTSNLIPNIYNKYGENITKQDLTIAMAQFWGLHGSYMTGDVFNKMFDKNNFTKNYEDTELNTLTNNCIKVVDNWFTAKSENIYGINDNVTYQDFITTFVNLLYDTHGFERSKDVITAANELGILDNMPTYNADDYIRYEDVALAIYNMKHQKKNNYTLTYYITVKNIDEVRNAPTWEYIPMSANNYTKSIKLTIGSTAATVNGSSDTTDAAPKIVNSRTMLPIRFVAEALGAEVGWNSDTRTVTIIKGNTNIAITIDSDKAIVNGQEQILDAPAFVENSRTYLPVRFVSENLGAKVDWDGATQTVTIQAN